MDQTQARKRAREIYNESGTIAVADTARWSTTGRLIIGGFPTKDQFWIVRQSETNVILDGLPIPTNPSDANLFTLEWIWERHCDKPERTPGPDAACDCGYCLEYERRTSL